MLAPVTRGSLRRERLVALAGGSVPLQSRGKYWNVSSRKVVQLRACEATVQVAVFVVVSFGLIPLLGNGPNDCDMQRKALGKNIRRLTILDFYTALVVGAFTVDGRQFQWAHLIGMFNRVLSSPP